MEKAKKIDAFNKLIQVNNDRIVGYETAFKETLDTSLKTLFTHCIQTSKANNKALILEVEQLGGEPIKGTKTAFKFLRVWMEIKTWLTNHANKSILRSCVFGEKIALIIYKKVLDDHLEILEDKYVVMITTQLSFIENDYHQVKSQLSQ